MFRLKSSNRWIAVLACFALSSCQILSSADDIAASVSADDKPRSGLSLDLLRAKDPQSKIGARGHPKVLAANGGAFESQKLDEMLAVIVGRLITHSNDPDRVFEITVLDSASVNAFALPGGKVGVHTGLFQITRDDAGLAAVIGHEVAHVIARHGTERLSRQMVAAGLGVGLGIALNQDDDLSSGQKAAVLGAYAQALGADRDGWAFLTGSPHAIEATARSFGVLHFKREETGVDHNLLTSLIDRSGTLRVQYMGERFDPDQMLFDLRALIAER